MSDPGDVTDRLAALEADNARLRRLLDAGGTHDGLRHAFRDTVVLLRTIMRQSIETAADVEGYFAHVEGRLDTITRVRERANAFGEADLHGLISDALAIHLVREGERAAIDGPTVRLRPRPAQVMALAVHELASNAVEHGPLGGSGGAVAVGWRVEAGSAGPVLALTWKETGADGLTGPARRGFGTRVLEGMLAYELGAQPRLAYEPDGMRYAVRLPLDDRVGRHVGHDAERA